MIDLRSDTVTKPSAEMRAAIAAAEVGDDVYSEDPTVSRLEGAAADLVGTEGSLFCTSGTQGNLLALLTHCQRGEEYIAGQHAHTYRAEGGGGAVLGSIQPQPIDFEANATLDLSKVAKVVKPVEENFPRTKLLCLENTHRGKVLPIEYLKSAREFANSRALLIHIDGARVFNAAVKLRIAVSEIVQHADSVSFCLSKGLGAPVGSMLCGSAAFILEARRWRRMLGGGMRQSGLLAAAGLFALENNIERLRVDHDNAYRLASGLGSIDEIFVHPGGAQTNMVYVDIGATDPDALKDFLREKGILIFGQKQLRLVTHLDINDKDVDATIAAFKSYFRHRTTSRNDDCRDL